MVGRPRLAFLERFNPNRPGRYNATTYWQEVDRLRVTYCGSIIFDQPHIIGSEDAALAAIEDHKRIMRTARYEAAYQQLVNGSVSGLTKTGRPIQEPKTGCFKDGSHIIQKTHSGWSVTHNHKQIAECATYVEARRVLHEHKLFWRTPRVDIGKRARIAVTGNKRAAYTRLMDGAGNYYAKYKGRIVVHAKSADECNAAIEEHWEFVRPIRALC